MKMKRFLGSFTILLSLSLLVVQFASARDLYVPNNYSTIQAAIDAAYNGDIVKVRGGTYTGSGNVNLDFKGKAITVRSENGPANCIIDCENAAETHGFYFHSGEGRNSVLDGFTIQNGSAHDGGGVYCYSSSPTITNCIIKGSEGYGGGGIFCHSSSPTIANCTVIGNKASYGDSGGGGICCYSSSSPTITNCTITGNISSGLGGGGGIWCSSSSPTITNCTITGNKASREGGGISCSSSSSPKVKNTILWDDSPNEIYLNNASITVTYSDIEGGWKGTGNINLYPYFANPGMGDYHLQDSSPCIGKGTSPGAPDTDIEGNPRPNPAGTNPDMGAYENSGPSAGYTIRATAGANGSISPSGDVKVTYVRGKSDYSNQGDKHNSTFFLGRNLSYFYSRKQDREPIQHRIQSHSNSMIPELLERDRE